MPTPPYDDHRRRAVVAVLNEGDYNRCLHDASGRALMLADDVKAIRFPGDLRDPLVADLDARGLLRAGKVLVQSPFDRNAYEEAGEAPRRFALEKFLLLTQLCKLLGASKVSLEQVELRTSKGSLKVAANGKRLGTSGEAEVLQEDAERLMSEMKLLTRLSGGTANVEAADALLRERGLLADPVARGLVDMHRDRGNRVESLELVVNGSAEARSNLTAAAKLKVVPALELSASFMRAVETHQEYRLTFLVEFGTSSVP